MRRLGIALIVCALMAPLAQATSISVEGTDLIGFRTTNPGGGLAGAGGWTAGGKDGGFEIAWDISYDSTEQVWNYDYTMTEIGGGILQKAISHVLLQVSDSITPDNYQSIFSDGDPAPEAPQTWTSGGNGNSDPNLPASIYAVKLEGGDGEHFDFESTHAPVWGSFYAKSGKDDSIWTTVWNVDFGTDPSGAPFTDWIPVPDTLTAGTPPPETGVIPEPATLTLLGFGLLGAAARRKMRKGRD